MTALSNKLRDILSDKLLCCCLCFDVIGEKEPSYNIEDEVSIGTKLLMFNDLIATVLGDLVLETITVDNIICKQCSGTIISTYKFIMKCRNNINHLHLAIDSLQQCTQNIEGAIDNKSLYVALDTSKYNVELYYDKHQIQAPNQPLLETFQRVLKDSRMQTESGKQTNSRTKANYRKHLNSNTQANSKREIESRIQTYSLKSPHDVVSDLESNNSLTINSTTVKSARNLFLDRKLSKLLPSIQLADIVLDNSDLNNLTCKTCFRTYPTVIKIRQHYFRMHAPKNFKCSDCPRRFGSSLLLKKHTKESHCDVVCSQCGKTYTNRYSLRHHEKTHKSCLVCPTCGKVYKGMISFKSHIKRNCQEMGKSHADPKLTCDYCNKKYTQKGALIAHIRLEHMNGKCVKCDWCNKKFITISRLKEHITKHTKQKDFQCKECGEWFVTKKSLLYHTRRHTGEKPYKCEHCDNAFLSPSRRTEHVKRHHLQSTLECDICFRIFKGMSLAKHRRRHFDVRSRLYNVKPSLPM